MSDGSNTDHGRHIPNPDEALRALLEEHGVLPEAPDLTEEERERTDQTADVALSRIVASAPADRQNGTSQRKVGRPHRLPIRRRGPAVVSAGLVTVAALVGGALVLTGPAHKAPSAQPPGQIIATPAMVRFSLASNTTAPLRGRPAAKVLEHLAKRALHANTPGNGGYQLITTEAWQLAPAGKSPSSTTRRFISTITKRYVQPDGHVSTVRWSGPELDKDGQLLAPTDAGRGDETDTRIPANRVEYPASLPSSPEALTGELASGRTCPSIAACLADKAITLHRDWVVSARVESSLMLAIAHTGEVEYLGSSEDRLGRAADAFVAPFIAAGYQTLLLISPQTGRLLSAETIQSSSRNRTDAKVDVPAVIQFTVFVSSRRMPTLVRPMDASATGTVTLG